MTAGPDLASAPPRTLRRPDIDAVRVGACLVLFVFHTGKVFDTDPVYHIKNADLSPAVQVLTAFIRHWHMPLFFLIAGWAAATALAHRSPGRFLAQRGRRLAVPLVFGIVLLCPPIKYFERLGGLDIRPSGYHPGGPFDLGFLEFLPRFFGNLSDFSWSHLWFLVYLLILTPLLLALRRPLTRGGVAGPRRWWIYAPLLPLIAGEIVLRPVWGDHPNLYGDWANMATYVVFLVFGAALARSPALAAFYARDWRWLGAIGLLGIALTTGLSGKIGALAGGALVAWGTVGALFGLAHRYVQRQPPALRYLSEATLPIYVLHHTPLIVLAFFVVPLALALWMKAALIFVGSILATFLLYHLAVRPWRPVRFLVGMPPQPTAQSQTVS